jgi:hypothetical protein
MQTSFFEKGGSPGVVKRYFDVSRYKKGTKKAAPMGGLA